MFLLTMTPIWSMPSHCEAMVLFALLCILMTRKPVPLNPSPQWLLFQFQKLQNVSQCQKRTMSLFRMRSQSSSSPFSPFLPVSPNQGLQFLSPLLMSNLSYPISSNRTRPLLPDRLSSHLMLPHSSSQFNRLSSPQCMLHNRPHPKWPHRYTNLSTSPRPNLCDRLHQPLCSPMSQCHLTCLLPQWPNSRLRDLPQCRRLPNHICNPPPTLHFIARLHQRLNKAPQS